jgi:hypothetical protein
VKRAPLVCAALVLAVVACGPKKKAELIYEEPVTNVWTGQHQPQAQPAPAPDVPPAAPTTAAPAFPESTPAAPSHQPDAYRPTQGYPPAGQAPPQEPYPQQGSQQPYPQQQAYPPGWPQQGGPQQFPPPQATQPQQQPPASAWRNAPPRQPPKPPATGFPDASVTTTVVPDQDPTTQTTLKRRTGWVRGGYD